VKNLRYVSIVIVSTTIRFHAPKAQVVGMKICDDEKENLMSRFHA
jgi:hypothetical protein